MYSKFIRKKWLLVTSIAAIAFSLASPAAGASEGVSTRGLTTRVNIQSLTLPAEAAAKLDTEGKRKDLQERGGAKIETPLQIKKTAEADAASPAAKPLNFVPASDNGKEITVIVELQSEPIAVHGSKVKMGLKKAEASYQTKLSAEQNAFASAAKGLKVRLGYQYKQAFNGFSLRIAGDQVDSLLALPGVKAVYPDASVKATPIKSITPNMDESAPFIGSNTLWDLGLDGTGIKVGVLDTGVDYKHPSLKDAYKGGYDFVDEDTDPYETLPDPNDPEAATEHGTHVAGTIVGRGDPAVENNPTGWVKGVAYGADLYAYRVLGPGGTGTDEDVIAAIDRSVVDGMDVINLSLGDTTNDQVSASSVAINNATLAGVTTVVSNGNEGPGPFTVGNPGTAELAISVGASSPPINVPVIEGGGIAKTYGSVMAYSPPLGDLKDQTFEVVAAGLGNPADFEGKELTGKVALISRGEISFVDKSLNAKAAGAVAALIYNNEPGNFGGTLGGEGDYIPTISLSQEDGLALAAEIEEAGTYSITFGQEMEQDLLADFSSRGPALPGLSIKPDISAPGVAIRSSVPAYGGDYTNAYADLEGTSMAAPHISGAAALLLEKYASLTPGQVKGMITNNAKILTDKAGEVYTHMEQGAGRVDLTSSIEAKAVAVVAETTTAVTTSVYDYETGSLSFGQQEAGTTVTKSVYVEDIAGESSTYEITSEWNGASAGTIQPSDTQVGVDAGGQASFNVALEIAADTADGYYEGNIVLTEAGGHKLHLPFAVYVGEVELPPVVSDVAITPDIFSPNGDGAADTSDIDFKVNLANSYFSIDVHDAFTGEWLGVIAEEPTGLAPGSYTLEGWDSSIYYKFYHHLLSQFGDGHYLLVPYVNEELEITAEQIVPFIVDVNAPESTPGDPNITVENGVGTITGHIDGDYLLDFFGDYSAIGVAAVYGNEQADGVIASDGSFEIKVPIRPGKNDFEVYVYDAALNGVMAPAYNVSYKDTNESQASVSAVASTYEAEPGQGFSVALDVYGAEDLYSAQFSLTYDANLTRGTVEPGALLKEYQESENPGVPLIVNESQADIGGGKIRSDYVVTLAGDMDGYSGTDPLSLAVYNFASDSEGTFDFEVSNVRLLNSGGEDIAIGAAQGTSVIVTETPTGTNRTISGNITAEAFGDGVDYSEVWYTGEDGSHKVVVEAVDAEGDVAGIGTVSKGGSYTIKVPDGTYTVRVVVPGHISETDSVTIDGDVTLDFGPLVAGDVNGNGHVDLVDLQLTAKEFGKSKGTAWPAAKTSAADINRDNTIDLLDVSFILSNYEL